MTEIPAVGSRRRAAYALIAKIPLFTLTYIPTIFLVDIWTTGEGFADLAMVLTMLLIYVVAVLVIIPALTFTLGRWIDRRTASDSMVKAASIFAAAAAAVGLVAAVPTLATGNYGLLPVVSFVLAPAVSAFLTRVVLTTIATSKPVRWAAVVFTVVAGGAVVAMAIALLDNSVA